MDQPVRIGHGYDLHRLEPLPPQGRGRPMVLGGVRLEHGAGPISHSDGDAVLHAVTDALLGALGEPDIGELFPDTDPRCAGADSREFLAEALRRMRGAGYRIGNLDITVICERPRISPHKRAMIERVAALAGCDRTRVNLKGKTHEQVDAVGEGRAIEVHCVVLLEAEAARKVTAP
jgi:2-C-methyl-D-erythritol 2,4-cyclodiphosphate synthase